MSKKRILHILYNLERGGAQEWLFNIIRHTKNQEYQIDVLIFNEVESAIKDNILKFGSKIILCPNHRNPFLFSYNLYKILNKEPKYNAVHTHSSYHAGIELLVAKMAGIPIRINHIRCDLLNTSQKPSLLRHIYQFIMRKLIKFLANKYVAVCDQAGKSMFGQNWLQNKKSKIVYSGIDFSLFTPSITIDNNLKESFGLDNRIKVIGHVGRFQVDKNHDFIIDIFHELTKINNNVILVLVGNGILQNKIKQKVADLNLTKKVIFTNERNDVPKILRNVFDIFLFPSFSEGIARSLMEAVSCGLPCLASDVITKEAHLIPELVHSLPLTQGEKVWARSLNELLQQPIKISPEDAFNKVLKSQVTIEKSVEDTLELY